MQLFRGTFADPPAGVFSGKGAQFSFWLSTARLAPGGAVLGRRDLDKLAKPLRKWQGPAEMRVAVQYELL